MMLFIVAFSRYNIKEMPVCALHALETAKRFSGCNVVGLTDMPTPGWQPIEPYLDSTREAQRLLEEYYQQYGHRPPKEESFCIGSLWRWFVMEEYMVKNHIDEPIFNADWDCLVVDKVEDHARSFGDYDYGIAMDHGVLPGSNHGPAIVIKNLNSLRFFVHLCMGYLRFKVPILMHFHSGDMGLWEMTGKSTFFNEIDVTTERNGAIFDGCIVTDTHIYEKEGDGKKIVWKDRKPFFVRRDTGALTRALCLHCFFAYRTRTGEIVKQLG